MTTTDNEQDDGMNCGLGMAERELLYEKLGKLPDTPPPRAVWQRIEAQARAEGRFRAPGLVPRHRWLAGAGIAAAVAALMLIPVLQVPIGPSGGEGSFPTEPAYVEQGNPVALRTLNALMVQSQQLEQDLRSLPEQPQLVRAGTAATIAAVEDQIAAIDHRLNESPVGLSHSQMEVYWRERVRLMNLLVQLRTAQTHSGAF
jgi:hypothetical protein